MAEIPFRGEPDVPRPAAETDRWPTGAKLFLILSAALLPLALIAMFATLRTTQLANTEVRALLRSAATESSRALAVELVGDMTALRGAAEALARDPADALSCARARGVFASQSISGARFVIADRSGRPLCGARFAALDDTLKTREAPTSGRILERRGALLGVESSDGRIRAFAFFPTAFLAELSRPSGFAPPYAASILDEDRTLRLTTLVPEGAIERRETRRVALGVGELVFEMQVSSAPINSPMIIALLLPLLMWAAAASTAWFVIDRLLIRPLRALRANVAAYVPGTEIDPGTTGSLPAHELRELGETFRAISRTVALHEAGLAAGLVRQTKLTREVHHRVKNNLQVIASLINFHSRTAPTPEASQAYASIQRRVDALSVVHRHHFAEMEDNDGLPLRAIIGELASNLRATTPNASTLGITIDIDQLAVSQDVAVAVAFLVTETVELALGCDPAAAIRISARLIAGSDRARLRISSPALVESDALRDGLEHRYGRIIEGLARQLRAKLHHEPLTGAFEIDIAIVVPADAPDMGAEPTT